MANDDWLRSRATFHLIIQGTSIGLAEARLREGLKRGRVRARAMDGTLEARQGGGRRDVTDWEIPPEIWSGKDNSYFSLSSDRYTSADFQTGYRRVELTGLSFHKKDLLDYLDLAPSQALSASEAKPRGGRKPSAGWPVFAAALAEWVVVNNDDAPSIINMGPDVILDAVLKLAQPRCDVDLPRSTFQPAIQEFIDQLAQSERRRKA